MKKKQKTCQKKPNAQIPTSIQFDPPIFNFNIRKPQIGQQTFQGQGDNFQQQAAHFSAEDRESLKNAFRYICRLIFKQAAKYNQKIKQIASDYGLTINNQQKFNQLFYKAEEISGERYFRKYINEFQQSEKKVICEYMRWFLTTKYLRYISEQGKGKRKKMKKTLYIKFKNEVMLPYIDSFL